MIISGLIVIVSASPDHEKIKANEVCLTHCIAWNGAEGMRRYTASCFFDKSLGKQSWSETAATEVEAVEKLKKHADSIFSEVSRWYKKNNIKHSEFNP